MAGEVFVGVLRRDDPSCPQDVPRVLAGRSENVDRMVTGAVGNDEPLVADEDDTGLRSGMPGMAASAQDGASPSPDDYSRIRFRNLA